MGSVLRFATALGCLGILPLHGVLVDGDPADWPGIPSVMDPTGDAPLQGPDFSSLKITNDGYNLYLLLEFTAPVNLRTANLTLMLDADNNPATGIAESGRGMDFTWDFDRNRGTSTLTSRGDIGRGNLIERIAPDASSTVHEIAISLEALPAARTGEPIHIVLREENSLDQIPDSGSASAYTLQGPLSVQPMPIDTNQTRGTIRIVSWNVLRDNPFKSGNADAFLRILRALNPDIVMFQEFYEVQTEFLRQYFRDNLRLPSGGDWDIARMHDCVTLSRYPIENQWPSNGNIVSRHATGGRIGVDLLISNNHFPCCDNESGRVHEAGDLIDLLEQRLGDATTYPQSLIIGGDLNSGGRAPELVDLTTSLMPLEMASPRHVYEYDQYTWGSSGSFWGSSRLDFLLFDPATLFRHKAFILDTDLLPATALADMGLEAADTFLSDHLVLVMDVRSPNLPDALQTGPMAADGSTISAWWGPLNGRDYPRIEHGGLGNIRLYETEDGYWSLNESGIWLWTGPGAWPWIYAPRFH
jgi:hypothetical protein